MYYRWSITCYELHNIHVPGHLWIYSKYITILTYYDYNTIIYITTIPFCITIVFCFCILLLYTIYYCKISPLYSTKYHYHLSNCCYTSLSVFYTITIYFYCITILIVLYSTITIVDYYHIITVFIIYYQYLCIQYYYAILFTTICPN